MASNNKEVVEKIYRNSKHKPKVIAVLSKYALDNEDAEIINPFGEPKEVYMECIDQLVKQVPLAIDRILS